MTTKMETEEDHEDDLEYHVTFPTPTPNAENTGTGLNSILRNKETAVMMVGWMNSKDQYLAKYSKIYEDQGLTTVRYSPTKADCFESGRKEDVARKLLDVLVEMNLSDNPVLFHIFSNGGCSIYSCMRTEMVMNREFQDIKKLGVVYDSAPGQPRILNGVNAQFAHYPPGLWTQIRKALFTISFLVIETGRYLGSLIGLFSPSPVVVLYESMKHFSNDCPELYLYSKGDNLIPYTDVDAMIEYRKKAGVTVDSMCWDDSNHAQHLRTHRESYMQQCISFVLNCMNANDNCEITPLGSSY